MLDTKGPEIRTGVLEGGKKIDLKKGDKLVVGVDYDFKGNQERIVLSYDKLLYSVQVGSRILIADGNLTLKVIEIDKAKNQVVTEVQNNF